MLSKTFLTLVQMHIRSQRNANRGAINGNGLYYPIYNNKHNTIAMLIESWLDSIYPFRNSPF